MKQDGLSALSRYKRKFPDIPGLKLRINISFRNPDLLACGEGCTNEVYANWRPDGVRGKTFLQLPAYPHCGRPITVRTPQTTTAGSGSCPSRREPSAAYLKIPKVLPLLCSIGTEPNSRVSLALKIDGTRLKGGIAQREDSERKEEAE